MEEPPEGRFSKHFFSREERRKDKLKINQSLSQEILSSENFPTAVQEAKM